MLRYRREALEREVTPSSGCSGTPPCSSRERARCALFDDVSAFFLLFEVCMSARRELSDRSVDKLSYCCELLVVCTPACKTLTPMREGLGALRDSRQRHGLAPPACASAGADV